MCDRLLGHHVVAAAPAATSTPCVEDEAENGTGGCDRLQIVSQVASWVAPGRPHSCGVRSQESGVWTGTRERESGTGSLGDREEYLN